VTLCIGHEMGIPPLPRLVCALPPRQATRVDPTLALRAE